MTIKKRFLLETTHNKLCRKHKKDTKVSQQVMNNQREHLQQGKLNQQDLRELFKDISKYIRKDLRNHNNKKSRKQWI